MLVPWRPEAQRAGGRHGVDHAVALDHRGGGEAELAGERAEDDVGIADVDQALILVDRRLRVGPVVADDQLDLPVEDAALAVHEIDAKLISFQMLLAGHGEVPGERQRCAYSDRRGILRRGAERRRGRQDRDRGSQTPHDFLPRVVAYWLGKRLHDYSCVPAGKSRGPASIVIVPTGGRPGFTGTAAPGRRRRRGRGRAASAGPPPPGGSGPGPPGP